MPKETAFKLTYATMFNPPEELHTRFEDALAKVKAGPGQGTCHAHRRQGPQGQSDL